MNEQRNQIDPSGGADSSLECPPSEEDQQNLSAHNNFRLQHLERRIYHLEKVIQRQIRLGRMVD